MLGLMTGLYKFKIKSLINMGDLCKLMVRHQESLQFYFKCLEYAWLVDDHECEISLYDRIGICYYLL